jgi:hypothetical protein
MNWPITAGSSRVYARQGQSLLAAAQPKRAGLVREPEGAVRRSIHHENAPPCMRVTVEICSLFVLFKGGPMNFSWLLRRLRWLLALVLGTQTQAHAANFTPDSEIQQIAEAYALDARDFAERAFRTTLDWSDSSVEKVEVILDKLYRQK